MFKKKKKGGEKKKRKKKEKARACRDSVVYTVACTPPPSLSIPAVLVISSHEHSLGTNGLGKPFSHLKFRSLFPRQGIGQTKNNDVRVSGKQKIMTSVFLCDTFIFALIGIDKKHVDFVSL